MFRPGAEPLVLTTMRRRRLEMYPLLKQELDQLKAGYTSPSLALLGIFLGAGLACFLTHISATLPATLDRWLIDVSLISAGLSIICAFRALVEWNNARKIVNSIQRETVEVNVLEDSNQRVTRGGSKHGR